jgi:aspartate ammonia-lyase
MGPRAGVAEILLPPVQPGSSIMPGKVNPSIPEMVNQVCQQVIGCDAAILSATEAGQLELNVMMPVIAWNALHATHILGQSMRVLTDRCVVGIKADEARCRELLDRSTALATALSPYIGYAETADIAKTAVRTGRSIRDLVRERRLLPDDVLDRILSVEAMTVPGLPGETNHDPAASDTPGNGAPDAGKRQPARGTRRNAGATPAHGPVPSKGPGTTGGAGPRRLAKARTDHGRARDRGSKRRR